MKLFISERERERGADQIFINCRGLFLKLSEDIANNASFLWNVSRKHENKVVTVIRRLLFRHDILKGELLREPIFVSFLILFLPYPSRFPLTDVPCFYPLTRPKSRPRKDCFAP